MKPALYILGTFALAIAAGYAGCALLRIRFPRAAAVGLFDGFPAVFLVGVAILVAVGAVVLLSLMVALV